MGLSNRCGQCGKQYRAKACGPTHAAIQAAGGDPSRVGMGNRPAPAPREDSEMEALRALERWVRSEAALMPGLYVDSQTILARLDTMRAKGGK